MSEEANEEDEISQNEKEVGTKTKSDIEGSHETQFQRLPLLATDLHLEIDIIHHRASLKLLQLNAGKTHCHPNRFTKHCLYMHNMVDLVTGKEAGLVLTFYKKRNMNMHRDSSGKSKKICLTDEK